MMTTSTATPSSNNKYMDNDDRSHSFSVDTSSHESSSSSAEDEDDATISRANGAPHSRRASVAAPPAPCPPPPSPIKTADERARETKDRQESEAVNRVRLICFMVYLFSALAVSVAIYLFALRSEQATFESEYDNFEKDISALVQGEVKNNFALMEQLAASVTSSARLTNAKFPYFTNSDFEVSGGYLDGLSGIRSVAFAPFVLAANQTAWEEYSVDNQYWISEGAHLRKIHPQHKDPIDHKDRQLQEFGSSQVSDPDAALLAGHTAQLFEAMEVPSIFEKIYTLQAGEKVPYMGLPGEVLTPAWQIAPTPDDDPKMVNYNLVADPIIANLHDILVKDQTTVMSRALEVEYLFDHAFNTNEKDLKEMPHSYIAAPVYNSYEPDASMVGFLLALTSWENLFSNVLPKGAKGVHCVVRSDCGDEFTFELRGPEPVYLGIGDHHDPTFDFFERTVTVEDYPDGLQGGVCAHHVTLYPTQELRACYSTAKPTIYFLTIVLAFIITGVLFVFYDRMMTRRQEKAKADAKRTSAIVSSLFPANVRDRLFQDVDKTAHHKNNGPQKIKDKSGSFGLEEDESEDTALKSKPIADLFPEVTVMFADIAGFTAWSSAREPCQVFELLETLYSAFDEIAKRRRVFKVETVGDCYVAACGLPEARRDHVVVMARFARDCLVKTIELTQKLECTLGPDTGDLAIRIGMHSGPVTAGVLRGDNARFQLFGDTMNTAARVESNGLPGRIQVSQDFADLLIAAGKGKWLTKREDRIVAKGKGEMQTYWVHFIGCNEGSTRSDETSSDGDDGLLGEIEGVPTVVHQNQSQVTASKVQRLIDWNTTVLLEKLQEVVDQRNEGKLDDSEKTAVTPEISSQLTDYVTEVAERYRDNPFHNFEHASHVTMSVIKLLSRVVASEEEECASRTYTKGISSNALVQLGVIFSALIHDVDHEGVPNAQLAQEKPDLAAKYDQKSIAEKNSIDVALRLLLQPQFEAFRTCIAPNDADFQKFRDTVVHATLATDIVDKELKADRNARWEHAFHEDAAAGETSSDELKVRIVLEHLIQASDVCHTMQHWHIYRKWNERLFFEMYKAFKEGRAQKDPSEFWVKGELGFFDFYIIPLAKKLADCQVFGVSSNEYLNYAEKNRKEWELKGPEVVAAMVEKYEEQHLTHL